MGVIKYGFLLTKHGVVLTIFFSLVFYTSYFVFAFYVPQHLIPSVNNRLAVQEAFNSVAAVTLIVTSFFIYRINKLRAIYICSLVTSMLAVLIYFVSIDFFRVICFSVIAMFFGIGQLAFLTYFWNLTVPEERGRIAGLNGFLSTMFSIIVYTAMAETIGFNSAVSLGITLNLGPLVVALLKPGKSALTTKKNKGVYYHEKRTVFLYLIPWILFCLNNATLAKNISFHISQQVPSSLYLFLIVLQSIGTIFGTLSSGIVADFFGRKAPLVFSLTLYGISSALVGIANGSVILFFVYVANGLSWGVLLVMYGLVVWGDLANQGNCAKMYAIGFVVFYLSQGLGLLPLKQIFEIPLVVSSLLSCLLIFLSNIPIFFAPELLSSDFRERIKLKLHMSAVKKIKRSRNQG